LKEVPRLCTKGSTLKKDVFYVTRSIHVKT